MMKLSRIVSALLLGLALTGCSVDLSNPYRAPELPQRVQDQVDADRANHRSPDAPDGAPPSQGTTVAARTPEPVVNSEDRRWAEQKVRNEESRTAFVGDLDTGSVTHVLDAGSFDLAIDYWSNLDQGNWTVDNAKPVNLSARIQPHGSSPRAYLSRFSVKAVTGGQVASTSEDRSSDDKGYLLTAPYTYNGAFVLDPGMVVDDRETLTLQYDLLVRAGNGDYFKQTVIDTLTLRVSPPASAQAERSAARAERVDQLALLRATDRATAQSASLDAARGEATMTS